jgi:fatty-acyl-CoA synthase
MPVPAIEASVVYIERLVATLTATPDRPCLTHVGVEIRSGEFLGSIYRFAHALDSRGIGPGDVVAILGPNHPDALAVRYAANLIGAGATFLSVAGGPRTLAELIGTLDPQLLVVFPETAGLVPAGMRTSIAGVGMAPPCGVDLNEAALVLPNDPIACRARSDDLAVIVSSGGSTGIPKGSWRTFASYTAMVAVPSPADRRQLVNGPLAYLSQVLVDVTLLGGGTVVLRDCYEATDTAATIEAQRITDLFLVEPQLFDLMDHPCLAATDLSSLRTVTHIGASAPPTLRRRARERFGARIVHPYGASEEGLVSILSSQEDDPSHPERSSSAGRILPGVEVRFRRTDGTFAAAGEIGGIEVRSPAMAQGYRNRPDLQAVAFQDGWYRSGDLGRLDDSGCLHVLGRAADVTFVEGRMISPTLIEDTLCRVPEVRYASVVIDAQAHRRVAVVLPRLGARLEQTACFDAVAAEHGDAVARSLILVPGEIVPLTPQGKPDREAIRALGRAANSVSRNRSGRSVSAAVVV